MADDLGPVCVKRARADALRATWAWYISGASPRVRRVSCPRLCVGMRCRPPLQHEVPGTPFNEKVIASQLAAPMPTQSRGHGTQRLEPIPVSQQQRTA
jgi:hypothetical protein